MMNRARLIPLAVAAATLGHPLPAAAQGPRVGWFAQGDVGFNLTAGNAKTSSLAFKLDATRSWLRTEFKLSGGGMRANAEEASPNGLPARYAVGSIDNIVENTHTVPKAANYFAHADFLRRVTERFFWKIGSDFERDQFSGIDSRVVGRGGLGYFWANRDTTKFSTSVDATYTQEKATVDAGPQQGEENFPGVRFQADLDKKFGMDRRNTYVMKLIVDENLKDTEDVRTSFINSLAVDMNRYLALKAEVQLRHDNQPAFIDVPLFAANPLPGDKGVNVAAPAEKLDSLFRVAVVINFTPGRSGSRPNP
jgi:putative salt-induced outer membrane protein YdiY